MSEKKVKLSFQPPKDKFVIRLPEGFKEKIKELSKQNHRSMNSEFVFAIEKYINGENK